MLFRFIILIGSVFLLHSCASISPPTGGAKDEKPPKLLKSIPESGQLNYLSNEFRFIFNEYIVVDNLNEQLIINPPIEGSFEAIVRKNRLTLIFEENLKPNTTYTLNFRQGIKDITEGNINPNLKLAFSTGSNLDTLKIKGSAKDLLTNVSTENILVSLYKTSDTSIVTKNKPLYFTRTDKNGDFLLENVKEESYRIYALKDANGNLFYDNEKELIDSDSFNLEKDTLLNFLISKHYNIPPRVNSTSSTDKLVTLTFSKGIVGGLVNILDKGDSLAYTFNGNQIRVYNNLNLLDSIPLYIQVKDSANNVLEDTVQVMFKKEKAKQKERENKKSAFSITPFPTDRKLVSPVDSLMFGINIPAGVVSYNLINVKTDTTYTQTLNNQIFDLNQQSGTLTIKEKLAFKDSVIVNIGKGAILSVYGDTLPEQKIVFTPKNENEYAILGGKVHSKKQHILLQLLNDKYQVINQTSTANSFKFDYVPPGTYYLRAVIDKNKNKQWDPGNFNTNLQPEEIYFHKEKIELRANWEITDLNFPF